MSQSSGASVAPGTRPDSPRARPCDHVSAATPVSRELGATAGAGVRTGAGLCRPPLRRGACWGISRSARIRPALTSMLHPCLPDHRHLCPYSRYRRHNSSNTNSSSITNSSSSTNCVYTNSTSSTNCSKTNSSSSTNCRTSTLNNMLGNLSLNLSSTLRFSCPLCL